MAELDTNKARYIQNRGGIEVSATHFISREGAKLFGYPTFWKNNDRGGHIDVVKFEGEYYLTQPTVKPHAGIIPYATSTRKP